MEKQQQTVVSVQGLQHCYKLNQSNARSDSEQQRFIIKNLNLELNAGDITAIVGRSGSGKSTLLNLIGGLEPIQQGTISLLGSSLNLLNDNERTLMRRQHIGFVYQSFNLIPTLSVGDNITLPLALNGSSAADRAQALHPMLKAIDLQDRESEFPDVLSGGEQQRVALARALIHKPSLILADEPTGNLDAATGRKTLSLLTGMVREHNSAMVLVTHSQEVASIAKQVLLMRNGTLHSQDTQATGSAAW